MDLESTLQALSPRLLRFCIGIMGNTNEGEDLAQEALTALIRWWSSNGPPESPAAFVYTVARRQAGRFRRRWRRFLSLDIFDTYADPACSPETASAQKQELQRALKALKTLSRPERQALLIAMDKSISLKEAAQILKISTSAFKMRVHRARRRLLHWLEEEYEIPKKEKS